MGLWRGRGKPGTGSDRGERASTPEGRLELAKVRPLLNVPGHLGGRRLWAVHVVAVRSCPLRGFPQSLKVGRGAGVPEQLRREDRKGAGVAVKAQTALSSDPLAAICPDVSSVGDLSPYLEAKGQRREGGWAA